MKCLVIATGACSSKELKNCALVLSLLGLVGGTDGEWGGETESGTGRRVEGASVSGYGSIRARAKYQVRFCRVVSSPPRVASCIGHRCRQPPAPPPLGHGQPGCLSENSSHRASQEVGSGSCRASVSVRAIDLRSVHYERQPFGAVLLRKYAW